MSDPNQPTKVTVQVYSARDLYNTNLTSKMDPYCLVTMGGQSFKTNIHKGGSKMPVWNQTFIFAYAGESTLRFQIFDKDKFSKDDYIGMADVTLSPIIFGPRYYLTEIELTRAEGKKAGFLKISIDFEPKLKDNTAPKAPPLTPSYLQASSVPQYQVTSPGYMIPPVQAPCGYTPLGYNTASPTGYPQQGYPPQSPHGYPPSPHGYPPSPQGYPPSPQGYPSNPQGYPSSPQGYPSSPQGYPPVSPNYPPASPGYPPNSPNVPTAMPGFMPIPTPNIHIHQKKNKKKKKKHSSSSSSDSD